MHPKGTTGSILFAIGGTLLVFSIFILPTLDFISNSLFTQAQISVMILIAAFAGFILAALGLVDVIEAGTTH